MNVFGNSLFIPLPFINIHLKMFVCHVIPLETDKNHLIELAGDMGNDFPFFLATLKTGHTHINEFCPLKNAFHL